MLLEGLRLLLKIRDLIGDIFEFFVKLFDVIIEFSPVFGFCLIGGFLT